LVQVGASHPAYHPGVDLSGQEEQRLALALGYSRADRANIHVARRVGRAELTALLVAGDVPVLVEDYISDQLSIVADEQRFEWWKRELKPRLVEPDVWSFDREGFPGGYCYTALLCHVGPAEDRVVLCRAHH